MINTVFAAWGDILADIYNITLPVGITFGALVVAVFGLPVLVRAFKKLMG